MVGHYRKSSQQITTIHCDDLKSFKQVPQKIKVSDPMPSINDQHQMKQVPVSATANFDRRVKLLIVPNASELL